MILKTDDGKFKVKGHEATFDSAPDAVTFMRSMMIDHRKKEMATKGIYGPTSFDELDQVIEAQQKADAFYWLTSDFMWLVDNTVYDPEITNKGAAIRQLANEFADRVEDLGAGSEVKSLSLVERVKDAVIKALHPKRKEQQDMEVVSPSSSLMFYKSGDVLKWVATYSNNFIDDDNPKEIIAAESHRKHIALVKAGLVSPPDLWLWHESEWKWGTGEWATFDEQGDVVFAIAGGSVDKGFEELAEVISNNPEWGVSHGMPKWSVSYDKDNPHVIAEHITEEVSPLPMWAAANKFTSFSLNKEAKMSIPMQEKARLMAEYGLSESLLSALEASNQTKAASAASQNRLFKDADASVPAATAVVEVTEPVVEVEVVPDAQPVEPDSAADEPVVEVKQLDLEAIIKSITTLAERVNELSERVAANDAAIDTAVAEKAAQSPIASLLAHMQKAVSPIGDPSALVDGRTALAKSQPVEVSPVPVRTGIPMVDGFLNGGGK